MTGLIERLEAATGPDRELDAAIWRATVPEAKHWPDNAAMPFTASIDAALTLVPEGWSYTVAWLHRNSRACVAMFHAKLEEQRAEAPTPALAICIAALKARGVQ